MKTNQIKNTLYFMGKRSISILLILLLILNFTKLYWCGNVLTKDQKPPLLQCSHVKGITVTHIVSAHPKAVGLTVAVLQPRAKAAEA